MGAIRNLVIGIIAAACVATIATSPAAASPSPKPADFAPRNQMAATYDGYLYAFEHVNYDVSGAACKWFYNDRDWATCPEPWWKSSNMLNKASSIANNAPVSAFDDVNLYYNRPWENNGYSAWACIGQGDAWPWLGDRFFSWGPSGPGDTGRNRSTQDNITGHKWVDRCGDV